MSIIVNNIEIQSVFYNGVELDKVIYNNVEVFSKSSIIELTSGNRYKMGDFEFICAEKLADGVYAMQMSGYKGSGLVNSADIWPGYRMIGDYNTNDISYKNIIWYVNSYNCSDLRSFYNTWKSIEANGGRNTSGIYSESNAKNGFYLMPESKLYPTNSTNHYFYGLYNVSVSRKFREYNATAGSVRTWTGTPVYSNRAYEVPQSMQIAYESQTSSCAIAPAFNIDTSKISLSGDVISIK